jgi:DMSO reductase family type II enzyme heme b subunit
MMGYASKANIWHWLADRDTVREMKASGPGTQTPLKDQNVKGKGEYRDGKWKVMFKRSLKSMQDEEFEIIPDLEYKIAFALWNGSKMESFARKSISILAYLKFERKNEKLASERN